MGKINTMEKEFITYELAIKLRNVGFDEECMGYWDVYRDKPLNRIILKETPNNYFVDHLLGICLAPLWQQAFDWFRIEHNLHALNSPVLNHEWTVVIDNTLNAHQVYWDKKPNYEEARLECIRKLIEIVANKKG